MWYTLIMTYDYKKLYEKNAAFFKTRPRALQALFLLNTVLTALFMLAYVAFLVYAAMADFSNAQLFGLLGFPALCLCLVVLLRLFFPRPRPYSEHGAQIEPFLKKHDGDNQSFPSRHVASAFVIATVLLPYLAWASLVLYVLGFALAYVRFALGVHYPSDLAAGAVLGVLCGLLIFLL